MHRIFMGAEKASEIRARRILRRNFATPSGPLKDVKMLNAKCNTVHILCVCVRVEGCIALHTRQSMLDLGTPLDSGVLGTVGFECRFLLIFNWVF